jgi:hypothetical protein
MTTPESASHLLEIFRAMPAPTDNRAKLSPEQELRRIIPLEQVAELRACSVDTIRRTMADKIIKISERRVGMRLGDALS